MFLTKRFLARKAIVEIDPVNFVLSRNFCDGSNRGIGDHSTVNEGAKCKESANVKNINNNSEKCDVAIVGGGMVGLAVACALSRKSLTKHLSVAIIDSNPGLNSNSYLNRDQVPDSRVSTVTPATISFFREIGAWDHVLQQRHAFFDKMQVWDYTGLGYTRYSARDVGKEWLGCVVENKVLCNSLLLSLREKEGFENTIYSTRLESLTFPSNSNHSNLVKLDLTDGRTLHAKLVVGADGAKSLVRQLAGINTTGWSYPQSALICTVKHSNFTNTCAWQRFLPSGPIALLPIGENYSNIVWTMSTEDCARQKSTQSKDFIDSVNKALNYSFTPGQLIDFSKEFEAPPVIDGLESERMGFPLSLNHASDYVKNNLVLVGDSAHAVHPLAGQGVNLGFGDASALARVLERGVSVGTDIGEINLLKRYEKERKSANIAMMAILDGFQKVYSVDFGPINLLRAAAFQSAQYISPLKKNIISYAMGEQKFPLFS